MQYLNTLIWVGFCQALFAALLMVNKQEQSVSDKILTTWLLLIAFEFLLRGIRFQPYQLSLFTGTHLLFNAALYQYVKSLTVAGFRLKPVYLLHLIPYLLIEILNHTFGEHVFTGMAMGFSGNHLFGYSFALINLISWMIYSPLSITMVRNYRKDLQDKVSSIEKNENIRWLFLLTTFYVFYCLVGHLVSLVVILSDTKTLWPASYNFSFLLILVYMLSFYGLRQKRIPEGLQVHKEKKGYKNPLLSQSDRKRLGEQVLQHVQEHKIYLNPDLSMDLLSVELGVPKHQLTEVLNVELGKNFFQFINTFRIEAVKEMLKDINNLYSVEAIGYECGFSNKSSFFRIFKETVGLTPLEYRNNVKISKNDSIF